LFNAKIEQKHIPAQSVPSPDANPKKDASKKILHLSIFLGLVRRVSREAKSVQEGI
jgi:hypothetical protein